MLLLSFTLHSPGMHTSTGVMCSPSAGCCEDDTECTSMSFGAMGQDIQPAILSSSRPSSRGADLSSMKCNTETSQGDHNDRLQQHE